MVIYFPCTMESSWKMKFQVNDDITSKVSLCQRDITKINGVAIVDATVKTVGVGGVDEAIHDAAGPGFLDEYWKLNWWM